jgi:phage tail sheath gpL-like
MPITANSTASVKGVKTTEKSFAVQGSVLESRTLISGGFLPAKTGIVAGTKYPITSIARAADLFGFGSPLHRMAIYHFKGATGAVPLDALPLPAAAGGVAATKTVTFATNASSSGQYIFRCGSYLLDDIITLGVVSGQTPTVSAAALVAAVGNIPNLPFTAANADGVVTLTAKYADSNGELLLVTCNAAPGEDDLLPSGQTVVIAAGTTGAGTSAITGLTAFLQAESSPRYTSLIQPYTDATTLSAIAAVVGNPNDGTGLYDDLDYRALTNYIADTAEGEAGLAALIVIGASRKLDAATTIFGAPDYPELGYEIAAYVAGYIALGAVTRSSNEYGRYSMPDLYGPMDVAEDWATVALVGSKSYDNRNLAVRAGITPLIHKNGVTKMGDVSTTWHPDDNQNAPFKFQVNRTKIWNVQFNANTYLNGQDLMDRPIVYNSAAVKQSERPMDADTIRAGLAELAGFWEKMGWIYDAAFTIANMTVEDSDTNPDRFDITIPIIVSGNNRVNAGEVQIDRNLQAVTVRLAA